MDRTNYDRTRELVRELEFPTAVFTADATRLALVASILAETGVPTRDYALGCFDEPYLDLSEDLMVVRVLQPLREIGRKAVDLILERLDGPSRELIRLLLPPEILVTGAPSQTSVTP